MEEQFLEFFSEILAGEEDAGSLNLRDRLEDIEGWDSLAALSLLSLLDDEYGVIMRSEDLEKIKTIQDVLTFVKFKLKSR